MFQTTSNNHEYFKNIYYIQFLLSIKDNSLSKEDTLDIVYTLFFRFMSVEILIFILAYYIFVL